MKKKRLPVLFGCLMIAFLTQGSSVVLAEDEGQQTSGVGEIKIKEQEVAANLKTIETELQDSQGKIKGLESKKERLLQDIGLLYAEVSDVNVRVQKREVQMREQARTIQVSGSGGGYLDILINSESIAKALSRFQGVKTMVKASNNLLKEQNEDKKAATEKTQIAEKQILALEAAAKELENKQNALTLLKIQQKVVKNELEAQRTTEESQRSEYLSKKEAAQKRLVDEQTKATDEKEQKKAQEVQEALRLAEAQAKNPGLLRTNVVGSDGVTSQAEIVRNQNKQGSTLSTSIGGGENVSAAKKKAATFALNAIGQTNPTGWGQSGECIVAVQNWLNAAGVLFTPGGPHSGYIKSGAVQVPWSQVQVGDVVQYEHEYSPDSWLDGVHTVLVVGVQGGNVQIVESNNPAGSGYVSSTVGWTPRPYVGNFRAVVWRFPG